MRYYETNFYRYEQPLIDELRKEGYFVYGIRDGEGVHSTIEPKVFVNNIGFLVTDTEIKFHEEGSWQYITDTELNSLGIDSPEIYDEIKAIRLQISEKLKAAKEEYDRGEAEREKAWKEVMKIQNNRMERDRHYNLSLRKDNPVMLPNGLGIRFQTIYDNGDGTQEVMYFIKNPDDKIIIDSTKLNFKLNESYKKMAKEISKKHAIAA
nr:hypothetical protein [uncultured Butyrivibrio sp.]